MIKKVKVYPKSRNMDLGSVDNFGLGVTNDNLVDIIYFEMEEMIDGQATLLTDIVAEDNTNAIFPLEKVEKGYQLTIKKEMLTNEEVNIQLRITNEEKVWNSKVYTTNVFSSLEAGSGSIPSGVALWLENADNKLLEVNNKLIEMTELEETISTNEEEREEYITQFKQDVENGEFDGDSAYEIAVKNGFDGTEEEWLESLKGGGGTGTSDYRQLTNKPKINGIELNGNKTFSDLGITNFSGNYNDLSNKPTIPTKTSQLTNDSNYITSSYHDSTKQDVISDLSTIRSGASKGATALQNVPSDYAKKSDIPTNISAFNNDAGYLTEHQDISGKQDKLVSGTNIKTINNQSILGNGNITIQGGSGGTSDYEQLSNKPSINNVELDGNKSLNDLGINNFSGDYNDLSNQPSIPSKTSDLENDSNFISEIPDTYVKNTDYMKLDKGGVAKVNPFYAVTIDDVGNITSQVYTNEQFNTKDDKAFVSKGTLENIKSNYVKDGLVNNSISLTDEEQLKIEDWLGLSQNYLTYYNETPYSVTSDYIPAHKKYVDKAIKDYIDSLDSRGVSY